MSEDRKCPKCCGEMEKGKRLYSYGGVLLTKKSDLFGTKSFHITAKVADTSNSRKIASARKRGTIMSRIGRRSSWKNVQLLEESPSRTTGGPLSGQGLG